jgi:ATP-dependent RNA helicase DbpA
MFLFELITHKLRLLRYKFQEFPLTILEDKIIFFNRIEVNAKIKQLLCTMQKTWDYEALVKGAIGGSLLPLQQDVIKTVKTHSKIQICAPTGSGKTIAFCLGLLEAKAIYNWEYALIIAPTRELVLQIGEVFSQLKTGLGSTVCYGGHPFKTEVNNFLGNPSVIIGTPGRIADHIRRESFDFSKIGAFIIDEEDKMKELGFSNEIDQITTAILPLSFTIDVSATALKEGKDVFRIDYTKKNKTEDRFTYYTLKVEEELHKAEQLIKLLFHLEQGPTLVFFNHREAVDRIADYMQHNGFNVVVYHGGLDQSERERNLIKFRNKSADLLFVTDLAARGIDVPEIKRIIHYQFPNDVTSFIHRNGRTARMGADGDVFIIEDKSDALNFEYLDEIDMKPFKSGEEEYHWDSEWVTLYLSLGKKDKINKIDVLGFLTKDIGVSGKDIGKIDTMDYQTYIAVSKSCANNVLNKSENKRIKKQKVKFSFCK